MEDRKTEIENARGKQSHPHHQAMIKSFAPVAVENRCGSALLPLPHEQFEILLILSEPDQPLEFQTDFPEHTGRIVIVAGGYGDNPLQPQNISSMSHHCGGRLDGMAFRPMLRKKGEADIHIFRGVA